jgi:anti-sigma regulatory factor (Ser/Thr protein kinase)
MAGPSTLAGVGAGSCDDLPAPLAYGEEERAALLRRLGAGDEQVAELLRYGENPYRAGLANALGRLPLGEEAHVAVWREWAAEAAGQAGAGAGGVGQPPAPKGPGAAAQPPAANPGAAAQSLAAKGPGAVGMAPGPAGTGMATGAAAVLCRHLVQLRFAIRAGISQEPAYRAATRRGAAPPAGEEGVRFADPGGIAISVHETVAGAVPVVAAAEREDFVALVRALAGRNEPVAVPAAMGACLVKGLTNWHRVELHRRRWREEAGSRGDATDDAAWQAEMGRLAADKDAYQDRLLLLSAGPYSAVGAAEVARGEARWRAESLAIRREHEAFHYLTLRLCGLLRSNVLDELLADMAGLLGALGEYGGTAARRFLGVDRLPELRPDARLRAYAGDPPLSPPALQVAARLAAAATANLERVAAGRPEAARSPAGRAALLLALAQGTLEELADGDAMARRWETGSAAGVSRRQPGSLVGSELSASRAAPSPAGAAPGDSRAATAGTGSIAGDSPAAAPAAAAGAAAAWSCRAGSAAEVGECLEDFDSFARRERLDEAARRDLAVMLDELLTNAVRHAILPQRAAASASPAGRPAPAPSTATVALHRAGGAWELRLADGGPAFDPLTAPAPPAGAPLEKRVPGGVGIHLVRQLAASVIYERRDGENRLFVRLRS